MPSSPQGSKKKTASYTWMTFANLLIIILFNSGILCIFNNIIFLLQQGTDQSCHECSPFAQNNELTLSQLNIIHHTVTSWPPIPPRQSLTIFSACFFFQPLFNAPTPVLTLFVGFSWSLFSPYEKYFECPRLFFRIRWTQTQHFQTRLKLK